MHQPYEIIEHPADVGFRAWGSTREELFENAALAMMSLACDAAGIEEREVREIHVTAVDIESLLFAWLADILAIQDAEQIFFCRVEVTEMTECLLRGRVLGERYDKQRHHAGTYIKAVTMHQLRVEHTADVWHATVYLDV